jgi:hypothetical protein
MILNILASFRSENNSAKINWKPTRDQFWGKMERFIKRKNAINLTNRLIAFYFVVLPGFEPRQADPETAVLPLHHKTGLKKTGRLYGSKIHKKFCFTNRLYKKTIENSTFEFSKSIFIWLSHQDSNLDRQNQKLQCYHYTMRQS